ncbi:hypothetical protein B0A58_04350 [Flavobacterium branchiophilum NBRC 15030 = ATCC 35035]|uniref:Uncharacterized protein n=1 Tax=Flavobacterium branchiophilum TaxID=55197 RepID=A0A2H3KDE0_9FLAO|nr:hypothetical protein [Flavobacterium branchiophilum]OXA78462.1 hypothetical protein B0A58_04350 [Flavobacterium branchiophilum NBRC 15030 = ATCC 35035]PDS25679.1 hypothetical protein B0A77_04215 [Flavobacterium branchiophilum]TQM40555.1 hypothetical protein BC670_1446 [Flavobacterium branchiophilum]GEM55873.1 hypothetical protein FB1_20940 [Flavobacterium branchiophilum NBRC 15030 = ATCC 35035]
MKNFYLLTILLISISINYYTNFGFLLEGNLIGLWLFYYIFILPIGLMLFTYNVYRNSINVNKINLCVFLAYLLSILLSGLAFFDFKNLEILGDGATKYVIKIIYCIAFITSLISFLIFKYKIKAPR